MPPRLAKQRVVQVILATWSSPASELTSTMTARESFPQAEVLEYRGVNRPIAWAYKGVPAKIADASQTGRGEEIARQIEPIGPLRRGGVDICGTGLTRTPLP